MTQNLGRIGKIHSYTSVWIPNMILFTLVAYSSYKMQKEVPFQTIEKLMNLFITFYEKFRNILKKLSNQKLSEERTKSRRLMQ